MEQVDKRTKILMHRSNKQLVKIWTLYGLLIVTILIMVLNALELKREQKNITEQYVDDVTGQLSEDIGEQIQAYLRSLNLLADTMEYIPSRVNRDEFLTKQAKLLGFEKLILIPAEETDVITIPSAENIREIRAVQDAFEGTPALSYIAGESLLYVTPIGREKEPEYVLAGIRNKGNLWTLITPTSFQGKGVTCIVDENRDMVVSPKDEFLFQALDDIMKKAETRKEQQELIQMGNDITEGRSRTFEIETVNGKKLVISYQSLEINGWMLITLVPADMISRDTNQYMLINFVLASGIILILMLIFWSSFKAYRQSRKLLLSIAFQDLLTEGMNRAGFQMAYEKIAGQLEPGSACLILLNIRGFQLINESFGIEEGDKTLQHVYRKISEHIREGELAARSSMDHFLILLRESGQERIRKRMEEMEEHIHSFSMQGGNDYQIKLVWGAYQIADPALPLNQMEDRARATSKCLEIPEGGNFYSVALTEQMKQEQELNTLFESSLENHDFLVYFQPKIRLEDNKLGGAEALVRWEHPTRGIVSPGIFIPLLEKSKNICRLDLYVFEETCRFIAKRMQEGKPLFPISVNLSRLHFAETDFYKKYIRLKEKYGIPDGILELEMTESVYLNPNGRKIVRDTLHIMHENGILCSLDDFGVGFSSLGLLRELEVDTIKLDRQFFEDVTEKRAQEVIVSLVNLAGKLGIHTVSEGIETKAQLEFLRSISCDMVQGFIFSKPLPIKDFEVYADEHC